MTPGQLRELLDYNPLTGVLYWRPRTGGSEHYRKIWDANHANKPAMTYVNKGGYQQGMILRKTYLTHRVVWALVHGEWPPSNLDIDHINRVKVDNRIANLRLATRAQNVCNRSQLKSKALPKGVQKVASGRYGAMCRHSGKPNWLGTFDTVEEAAAAYDAAAKNWHGEFAFQNHEAA